MKKITYKSSGVDIDKANQFVSSIKGYVKSTMTPLVIKDRGAFGSLFGLPKGYKDPVLVSSTDGVGTKLLIAQMLDKHDTVGIDLVAMNVNDILCCGAKPLFFLDYIACGKVHPKVLKSVVKGISDGCKMADCSLVGGETAEMPGMYKPNEYDLAGFTVGVVERSKIIDGRYIREGDVVIGLPSSGLHSNGYSLVRKVLGKNEIKKHAAAIISPTRIYVKEVLSVLDKFEIKGIAHLTGGAYYEKLTKILPAGKCFEINQNSWPVPKIFSIIQKKGRIPFSEMYRTFNMGIGMVIVIDQKVMNEVKVFLREKDIKYYEIGQVVRRTQAKVEFKETITKRQSSIKT